MFMRAIAPAAIGSTILLASCSAGDDAANDDGGAFAAPVGYVLPVQRDVIEYDTFTGRFAALQDVEIRPRVSGFVETVEFEEGALVEAGQPLFRLDRERFAAEVTRLEAQRRESQTAADLAGTELARAEGLLERRAVSQEEVDRLRAEVLSAEAVVAGVDADIRRARIDLGDTVVRAPFAGRIGEVRQDVGALVSSDTPLARLVSVDPIEIVFDGSEADFLRYNRLDLAGEAASSRDNPAAVGVRLADEADWSRVGQINFIDNALDDASGTIRVKAIVPNPDEILSPGLFGEVRVPAFGPYTALLVPDEAIVTDQTTRAVLVVGPDDLVVQKPVELGSMEGELRIIRSGLEPGDRVIVTGLMMARPGAPVSPNEIQVAEASAAQLSGAEE